MRAYSGSTITNNGVILVLGGDVSLEDGVTFVGKDICYPSNIVGVSSEAELRSAIGNPDINEITIDNDITLNSPILT